MFVSNLLEDGLLVCCVWDLSLVPQAAQRLSDVAWQQRAAVLSLLLNIERNLHKLTSKDLGDGSHEDECCLVGSCDVSRLHHDLHIVLSL